MSGLQRVMEGLKDKEYSPEVEAKIREDIKKLISEFSNMVFGGIDPDLLDRGVVVAKEGSNPDIVVVGLTQELFCWLSAEGNKPRNVRLN